MKRQKASVQLRLLELAGLVLLDLSLVLAFYYQYRHFYEVLVLGLFLILYALDAKYLFLPTYARLYKQFIKAGLIGDLVLGLAITRLWHYNYASVWAYAVLYLFVYPIAGLVMLQTFILLSKVMLGHRPDKNALRSRTYRRAILALGGISLGLALLAVFTRGNHTALLALFSAIALWALMVLAYGAHVHHRRNLLDKFYSHPFTLLAVLLLATYINAFLHELPNTAAHEWTYTNWPLQSVTFCGVPVVVLLVWPALALYPASAYYYAVGRPREKASPPGTRRY